MEVEEAKLTNRSTQTGDTVGVRIGGREEGTIRGQGSRHGTQVVPRSSVRFHADRNDTVPLSSSGIRSFPSVPISLFPNA